MSATDFDRRSLAELFVARFQRIAHGPILAPRNGRSAFWRWLNRRRAYTLTSALQRHDHRTLEHQRRGDAIAERVSFWRVRQAWMRRELTDADGRLRTAKFLPPRALLRQRVLGVFHDTATRGAVGRRLG